MLQAETTPRIYRPTGRGDGCDAWNKNPLFGEPGQARLIRCSYPYSARITYRKSDEIVAGRYCDCHAAQLRAQKEAGRIEILSDEKKESEAV